MRWTIWKKGKILILLCTRLGNGRLLVDGKHWIGFADSEEEIINQMFGMNVSEYNIETEGRKNLDTTFEVAGALEPFDIRDGRLIMAQQHYISYLASQLVIEALSE